MALAVRGTGTPKMGAIGVSELTRFLPPEVLPLHNPQTDLPRIAKDERLIQLIEQAVRRIPTTHSIGIGDARRMAELEPESVHLVVTSPP
jgi:hypothetical protein